MRSRAFWLIQRALSALDRADDLLLEKQGTDASVFGQGDTERVFPHARTIAAALGLHAVALDLTGVLGEGESPIATAARLVGAWKPHRSQDVGNNNDRAMFRAALCDNLRWQVSHFTPFHYGVAAGLWAWRLRKIDKNKIEKR